MTLIDENGAPSGPEDFIFYNPPVVNRQLGIRRSSVLEAAGLASQLLKDDVHTIVFARADHGRGAADLPAGALPSTLGKNGAVRGYRGGYLPQQRREIGRGLRSGEIMGCCLDQCPRTGGGHPVAGCGGDDRLSGDDRQHLAAGGTVGAAGDGITGDSGGVGLAFGPVHHQPPGLFLRADAERPDQPDNLLIVVEHIKCAAFELPFKRGEMFGSYGPQDALEFLAEMGLLHEHQGVWHWMAVDQPRASVSGRRRGTMS
ncbi:MAG: hypothetical protein R2849_16080 [Thermomicrobiales bacterium]